MARWFNTAGPCDPRKHYVIPVERRLGDVERLIAQEAYFVLHAPRQTGKTTSLMALAEGLNRSERVVALVVSAEVGEPFSSSPGDAELAMLSAWRRTAEARLPAELLPPAWPDAPAGARIGAALGAWARAAARPVVLFIDEIDALRDEALLSVLRQLRDGYPNRPTHFPASVALVGLRDVREYRVSTPERERLGTASPFNIKVRSLTLRDFDADEVRELYAQHSAETGQRFDEGAPELAFELTRGQPWLVNALAKVAVEELVPDPAVPVTAAEIDRAKSVLIARQETHLDSLADKLRDRRIRAVIEPMLAGTTLGDIAPDDIQLALDLGLVRSTETGGLDVANPIYREVIVRERLSLGDG